MACAESPIQRSPVRDHSRKRSTETESKLYAPIFHGLGSIAGTSTSSRRPLRKAGNPCRFRSFECSPRNDVGALPVVAAIEHYENFTGAEAAEGLLGVGLVSRDAHPQDVNGSVEIDYFEPGLFANGEMAAVAGPTVKSARTSIQLCLVLARTPTTRPFSRIRSVTSGFHAQMKFRIRASFFCDEIQKIPLRHEADEFAMGGQMRKVRDCHGGIVDYAGD